MGGWGGPWSPTGPNRGWGESPRVRLSIKLRLGLTPHRSDSDPSRSEVWGESVSDRLQLDRERESRRLPSDLLNELCRHALDVAPEECCGLLVSSGGLEAARPVRITNIMTRMHVADPSSFPRDARHAYYMSEVEYLRALGEAETRDERVTAIYHSHFGQGCYLSRDDLAFASHPLFPFPDADQIVISLLDGKVEEVGLFEPSPSSPAGFSGCRLEAAS